MNNSTASVRAASLGLSDNGVSFGDDAIVAHEILSNAVSAGGTADTDTANGCKVKLCGLRREQDVDAALAAGADAVGFIIDVPQSHRSISVERAAGLVKYMKTRSGKTGVKLPDAVGVFVDEPTERVAAIANDADLDVIQLHGHEDESYLAELRGLADVPIMQAFKIRAESDVDRARQSSADLVLLDAGAGDGKTFDWSLVRDVNRPFLLAGGLNAGNVTEAIRAVHPFGVDISSGTETNGVKDPHKMRAVVEVVRAAADGAEGGGAHGS